MDMDRATMKAATATAVRPRFCRMFPAATFPGSSPDGIECPFESRMEREERHPREKADTDEKTKDPSKAHIDVGIRQEKEDQADSQNDRPARAVFLAFRAALLG